MRDHGVITLDPQRMRTLELALDEWATTLLRTAGVVADAFAGTGHTDRGTVADLGEIAAWAVTERDDVVWRRAVIENLGPPLPLPTLDGASRAELETMARHLAVRLGLQMQGDAPLSVDAVEGMLAELDRLIESDPTMAAVFYTTLGPRRAAELSAAIEQAYEADWALRRPENPHDPVKLPMPEVDAVRLLSSHQRAMDALIAASRVEGDLALTDEWITSFTGVQPDADIELTDEQQVTADDVLEALSDVRTGTRLARSLAKAAGLKRAAVVLGHASVGATAAMRLVGVATAPLVLADGDGLECDIPEAIGQAGAGVLGLVALGAAGTGVGLAAAVGAGIFVGIQTLFGECESQQAHAPGNPARTMNPDTGVAVYPGGNENNGWTDEAGVPQPHNMVR